MRVVGGKTGTDGRLFAYIVWTVPAGPAEKGGLQQGDKVCFCYKFYHIFLLDVYLTNYYEWAVKILFILIFPEMSTFPGKYYLPV